MPKFDVNLETWKRERVVETPDVMGGEPVFRGSRLTLRRVAGLLERGVSFTEILADYPFLTEDDLKNTQLLKDGDVVR